MADSKVILFSGGHATCFETIKHCKPSIIIPTQPEQIGNGRKLEQLGCSIVARNREQLSKALKNIENQLGDYKENVEKLNEISRETFGVNEAVRIVESFQT